LHADTRFMPEAIIRGTRMDTGPVATPHPINMV
jgi:hypothetical protein